MKYFLSFKGGSISETVIKQMKEISKLVYRLAKYDDMSDVKISQDPCFLKEWFINNMIAVKYGVIQHV